MLAAWVGVVAAPGRAAVVVIANRTAEPLSIEAAIDDQPSRPVQLAAGQCRPLFAHAGVRVRGMQEGGLGELLLEPDCAYYIGVLGEGGGVAIHKIGLGESGVRSWQARALPPIELPHAGVIDVKVLVDDDEVRPRKLWERTIRERIDRASSVLDAHCGLQLRVAAIDTWDSDDRQSDFNRSLMEFEREVLPAPGVVAIGFSSQYQIATGRVHLGGTRGPLHSHILIKERSRNVLEPERLELLLHELGHFLGATHSPEPTSVMRPVIGQGLQRVAGAEVRFDPPNTLLLSLMAQEIRQRRIRDVGGLSPETRRRMREIYEAIDPTIGDDPASGRYSQIMAGANAKPLVEDTRRILQEINRVAHLQRKRNEELAAQPGGGKPVSHDQLLELYVRQAAIAAKNIRRDNAEKAFLLAMGVALDDAGLLQKLPLGAAVTPHMESQQERESRLAAFGQPTMRGRADLAKHFFVSAHLVVLMGSETARSAGLAKELLDSHGASGFSFADMAANRAGIVFAHALLGDRLSLDDVARRFSCEAFMPPIDGLREQLGAKEFSDAFGGPGDERLTNELNSIEARILALPAYQAAP
ncbi:MAG: hypothetical protein DCC67_03410 [Planctomycetota bacterium]|nr:MAG: hypothetical protein DCC67_03410 [Planctomycetota bacterium]